MKFTDGYWLLKKDVVKKSPVEIRDYKIENGTLTVYASDLHVTDRAQTVDRTLFTFKFSSPQEDIIRVESFHHIGENQISPSFEIYEDTNLKVDIVDLEDFIIMKSKDTYVKISKKNWQLKFYYKEKLLTSSNLNQMGFMSTNEGFFWREQLDLDTAECVYGLGERFAQFVKNGQVIDIWNEDGGTCSEMSYKNIPFYYTNKGYGVFVNHTEKVSFEVASEVVSRCQFSVKSQKLDYMIIGGNSPKEAISGYTKLTGRPALPPAWSFGLWLSTSFTTTYNEETVTKFINGMIDRDIPLSVFHFDCFWMKEYEWCGFEWDKDAFPDPESMLKRLKEKGIKISLWINPYIAQKAKIFKEAKENNYFIKNSNGDVLQTDMWQAGQGIVDFTNPEACVWYTKQLDKLIDMGVDCFKTDFGERIPVDGHYFDKSNSISMHNYYTYLYNKVVFEHLEKRLGKDKAILFARSATTGCQKFPVHWGGDCESKFTSMAESLRGGLSLASSGFGFWSHDIGGFEQTSTPDVYKRWVQFGLLSSHSRLHGSKSYRVPWLYDEEAVAVLSKFTKLKARLMPYIFHNAVNAHKTGCPLLRPMVMEYNDDRACDYLERQYMFGENLLIAPIFNEDCTVEYYLPKGKWTNILTNKEVLGNTWVKEKHDYFTLPIMVKENSIIPIGKVESNTDYDYLEGLELHLFNLIDESKVIINNIKGEEVLLVKAKKNKNILEINISEHEKELTLIIRNIFDIKNVVGAKFEKSELGCKVFVDKNISFIRIEL